MRLRALPLLLHLRRAFASVQHQLLLQQRLQPQVQVLARCCLCLRRTR